MSSPTIFFCDLSIISNIFIYIHEYLKFSHLNVEQFGKIILRYEYTPLYFCSGVLFDKSIIFINIGGYDTKVIYILHRVKELCLSIDLVPVLYSRIISN